GQPYTPSPSNCGGQGQPVCHFDGCTAEAVSSGNHKVVLTALHCVSGHDDFAFAPGYFGGVIGSCTSTSAGSSAAFACGTAPYGIWCAQSPSLDSTCGQTGGVALTSPIGCCEPANDFAFLSMEPSLRGCPSGSPTLGG